MATSCVAQKKLCTTTIARSHLKCCSASMRPMINRLTSIMVVQATIQARRPPQRSSRMRSTSGAQAHLKAQGRNSAAENAPITSRPRPCWRMNVTMATDVNP